MSPYDRETSTPRVQCIPGRSYIPAWPVEVSAECASCKLYGETLHLRCGPRGHATASGFLFVSLPGGAFVMIHRGGKRRRSLPQALRKILSNMRIVQPFPALNRCRSSTLIQQYAGAVADQRQRASCARNLTEETGSRNRRRLVRSLPTEPEKKFGARRRRRCTSLTSRFDFRRVSNSCATPARRRSGLPPRTTESRGFVDGGTGGHRDGECRNVSQRERQGHDCGKHELG